MLRCAAAALALVAIVRPSAPQELKTEVLVKLKSATVYVKVDDRGRRGTGTGFLFLKRGTTGYIMTCEHVVGESPTVGVVFWSGTAQEKSLPARVIATDPSRDLACLMVTDMPNLPAALELGRKTEVKETETVIAAGFPFGALLASGDKHPEISVSKSSVTSIRRNSAGDMVAVQIGGEVHPGNSGGPLVTMDGRVIGVNQSKVAGTGTAFAVPSEEIQGFLAGRVKASNFRKVGGAAKSGKYEITLILADPMATLKGAGIAYIDEEQVKGDPAPEKDGTWKKIHASMKTVAFKINEYRATERLEFKQEGSAPDLAIIYQSYYTRADGQTVWTEPATHYVEFGPGSDPAADRPSDGKKPPSAPAGEPDEPEPPPASEPPASPAVELTLPDAGSFANELPVSSVFGGLVLAPDGSALYALDLSEGQVCKLDPDTLKITAKLDVHESAVAMALTPDGKTLYVGGRRPPVVVMDTRRELPGPNGTLQVINTSTFTTTSTLDLKAAVLDLVATDSGLVVITCQAQWNGLLIVNVGKKSEEFVQRIYGGGIIRLARDQRRVYIGSTNSSPGDFTCVRLHKDKGQFDTYDSIYHGEHQLGGPFHLSPDGKYLIGAWGSILRLGRTRDADLRFAMKIDPFQTAALATGCGTLFTISADGFLKAYGLGTFDLQKSVKLGRRCERAALDTKRRKLHGVFVQEGDPRFRDRQLLIGRICSISLGAK